MDRFGSSSSSMSPTKFPETSRATFNSEKTDFFYDLFLSPRSKVDLENDVVVKNIELTKQLSTPIAKVTQWLILSTIKE